MEAAFVNLLPPEKRRELAREFWWRAAVFYGNVVLISIGLFAVGLAAMALGIRVERYSLAPEGAVLEELDEYERLAREARETARLLGAAETFLVKTERVSELLAEVMAKVPPGITLTKVHFARDAGRLELTGRARERGLVLSLETRLKKDPRVASVEIPLGSFTKAADVDFTLTLTLR